MVRKNDSQEAIEWMTRNRPRFSEMRERLVQTKKDKTIEFEEASDAIYFIACSGYYQGLKGNLAEALDTLQTILEICETKVNEKADR